MLKGILYGIMMVYLGQETKRYLDGKYYTNPFELNIISVGLTHFATYSPKISWLQKF